MRKRIPSGKEEGKNTSPFLAPNPAYGTGGGRVEGGYFAFLFSTGPVTHKKYTSLHWKIPLFPIKSLPYKKGKAVRPAFWFCPSDYLGITLRGTWVLPNRQLLTLDTLLAARLILASHGEKHGSWSTRNYLELSQWFHVANDTSKRDLLLCSPETFP